MAKRIAIDEIRADGGTQTRAELRPDVIEDYAEAMRRGDEFPPIDVFLDKAGNYWLADGFHRFNGAASAELPDILATVHKGELRDAVWFALSANRANGLMRTKADKRRCVTLALSDKQWTAKPDRELAEHVGVSTDLVNSIRTELSFNGSSAEPPKRKGKDGKVRPAKYKPRRVTTKPLPIRPVDLAPEADLDCSDAPASEPHVIGQLFERYDAFVESLITGQPPHVVALLKEHSAEVWSTL